jgi:hypothetical protein
VGLFFVDEIAVDAMVDALDPYETAWQEGFQLGFATGVISARKRPARRLRWLGISRPQGRRRRL